ncbi:methyltransferase domain-containing protein [Aliarcobacter skirrowii]|uniref:methyltransferase domain-containing protein n=1 Tax=Aliarcobacter skirrowii TaxID=28200 RepID=UPI0029B8F2DE|nr:methyltransferase domain-containing protein [Aliarcobacter skirrowii]MDX4012956.1 methyltransferase domain-containing protein [Aliarcobacter skirrowii]
MYKLISDHFLNKEIRSRTVKTELIMDEKQLELQDNSLEQYKETHELEQHSDEIKYLMSEFESFMALHLLSNKKENSTILDVGSGISVQHPIYFKNLKNSNLTYIGLDPFEINPQRDYLFTNGKFEGLHKYIDFKFDNLIFSTSLDHLENLNEVNEEITKVLKKDGIAFFWVGLHDPEIVSRQALSGFFKSLDIFKKRDLLKLMFKFPLILIKMYQLMRKRSIDLSKLQSMDNLHFHYFLDKNLENYMKSIGEIVDVKYTPFTNSVFYAVKL